MNIRANVPLKFLYEENDTINTISSVFNQENVTVFYGEIKGSFGEQVYQNQAVGIDESITVRMQYNPQVLYALQTKSVAISKGGENITKVNQFGDTVIDYDNANCYKLFGGVDNVAEENRILEFKAVRYFQK